jgi:hypothetical protein
MMAEKLKNVLGPLQLMLQFFLLCLLFAFLSIRLTYAFTFLEEQQKNRKFLVDFVGNMFVFYRLTFDIHDPLDNHSPERHIACLLDIHLYLTPLGQTRQFT